MKKWLVIWAVCVTTHILSAQQTETRKIEAFTKINVIGKSFSVELIKGEENKIEIESADLTLDKIITTVNGGELKISAKGLFANGNVKCKVYYTTAPCNIEVSSNAIVKAEEALVIENMTITTNSDGYANINTTATNVTANCNTGGDMVLKGSCVNLTATANGGGTLHAEQMEVENLTVKAVLNAEMHVRAKTNIAATAVSGGKIYIKKPHAPNITENIDTNGSIVKE